VPEPTLPDNGLYSADLQNFIIRCLHAVVEYITEGQGHVNYHSILNFVYTNPEVVAYVGHLNKNLRQRASNITKESSHS
jgi:pyruvate/2-oxoglutarate dehydrogenase complex dihydrolipoamide dehydrogenase (E3) component